MPLPGDGRSGTFSATVTTYGGYKHALEAATGIYPANQTQIVSQRFPKFDTLTDDFTTADTSKWTFSGTSVTGGQLVIDAGDVFGRNALTIGAYDLTDSTVSVELVQRTGATSSTAETYIHARLDATNRISFHIVGSTIAWEQQSTAGGLVSGSETYSATNHRFLRLGRSGNNWTWEKSANGASWTLMNSATAQFTGVGLQFQLAVQNSVTESVAPAIFDNVNLIPPVSISLTDTGSGSDALAVAAAVPLTDTGSGSDALTVTAAVPLTDTGAGTDALAVSAAVALSDTGSGTDTLSVSAAVALSDSGSGTDALSVNVPRSLSDTGGGSDALTVAAAVPLSDTGSGTDSVTVQNSLSLADTGAAADVLAVSVAVPLADTGTGTDTLAVVAQVPLSDTGSGADNLSTPGAPTQITLTDTGSAADALAVSVAASLTDTGTAADALAVAVPVALADAATAADALSVSVAAGLSDTGSGDDDLDNGQTSSLRDITVRYGPPVTRRTATTTATRRTSSSGVRTLRTDLDPDTRDLAAAGSTRTLTTAARS